MDTLVAIYTTYTHSVALVCNGCNTQLFLADTPEAIHYVLQRHHGSRPAGFHPRLCLVDTFVVNEINPQPYASGHNSRMPLVPQWLANLSVTAGTQRLLFHL